MDWRAVREKLLRFRKLGDVLTRENVSDLFPDARAIGKRCWIFDGCRNPDGYGKIRIRDNDTGESYIEYAHRASAAAFGGFDLNSDLEVAHACHNPACFSPWHVRGLTKSENLRESGDKIRPGKLDEDALDALRRYVRKHNGNANLAKFAASRGVGYSSVLAAVRRMSETSAGKIAVIGANRARRPVLIGKLPRRGFRPPVKGEALPF